MKSPHYLFLIVFGKCFPVVFNDETLLLENGVVWGPRLCHNDSWLGQFGFGVYIPCQCV